MAQSAPAPSGAPAKPDAALAVVTTQELRQMRPQDYARIGIADAVDQGKFATLVASNEEMAMRVFTIMASRSKGKEIPLALAIGVYFYELGNPGQKLDQDFFADKKMGIVPGYQGIAKAAQARGIGTLDVSYRALTPEENEEMEIMPGDTAKVCVVTQVEAAAKMRALSQPYHPVEGFGIVRKREKFVDEEWQGEWPNARKVKLAEPKEIELSGGYTWGRKARNRAYRDACRHIPGMPQSNMDLIENFMDRIGVQALPANVETLEALPAERLRELLENAEAAARNLSAEDHAAVRAAAAQAATERDEAYANGFDDAEPAFTHDAAPEPEPLPEHLAAIEPLRMALRADAAKHPDAPTPRQLDWTVRTLAALDDDARNREAVMTWAFGDHPLTRGEAEAIFNWAKPVVDPTTKQMKLGGDAVTQWPQIIAALKQKADDQPETLPAED